MKGKQTKRHKLKSIDDISPSDYNPREIDARSLRGLKTSLAAFGDISGIVWNSRTGSLVAGHQRFRALQEEHGDALELVDGRLVVPGIVDFPVRVVDWPLSKEKTAAVTANSALLAGDWSDGLGDVLDSIQEGQEELYDSLRFGELSVPDVPPQQGRTNEDEIPDVPVSSIVQLGDIWTLGKHRLLCGDATNGEDVQKLMGEDRFDLCFTSPPYAQQRDYGKKIEDWDELMQGVFGNLLGKDDCQVLVNLGLIHQDREWIPYWDSWIEWMRGQGWKRFGWYVWDQGHGMPGDWSGRCAPSHEFIFHFNRESIRPRSILPKDPRNVKRLNVASHTFRQRDGTLKPFVSPDSGLNPNKIPDSVWRVLRAHTGQKIEALHPAVFSMDLCCLAMEAWPGDVYDPFLGSGTILIAAERLGRRAFGIEIEPQYVEVALQRWVEFTEKDPVRQDGASFTALKEKEATPA